MLFKKVTLHNFGSWQHLEFDLSGQGLVLICGATGSGKSSIFRGIFWALFGETPEGHLADEVVRHGSKNTFVSVEFTVDGFSFKVSRYRRHEEFGNKVLIEKSGKLLTGEDSKVAAVNALILSVLGGVSSDLFKKTVFLVQRDWSRFPSLSESLQKALLEQVSGLQTFALCEILIKERLQKVLSKLSITEAKVDTLRTVIKKLSLKQKQEDVIRKASLDKLSGELRLLKASESDISLSLEGLKDVSREVEIARASLAEAKGQLGLASRRLKKLGKAFFEGICFYCGSAISKSQLKERQRVEFQEKVVFEKEVNSCAKILCNVLEKQKKLQSLQGSLLNVRGQILQVKERIKGLKTASSILDCRSLQGELRSFLSNLKALKQRKEVLEFWKFGFSQKGLRLLSLSSILQVFEKQMNLFVSELEYPMRMSYTVENGRIQQRCLKPQPQTYSSLSGGEKQIADLCSGLSLRSLAEACSSNFFNLLILDEPFEGLSGDLQQKTHKLLRRLNKPSVFLLSHQADSKNWNVFDKVYRVTKRGGVSWLERL